MSRLAIEPCPRCGKTDDVWELVEISMLTCKRCDVEWTPEEVQRIVALRGSDLFGDGLAEELDAP
jgi:hypothetical protein